MKRLNLLIVVLLSSYCYAQISISRNEIPDSVGYSSPYLTSSNVEVNLGTTGGPQRWDFSTIPLTAVPTLMEIYSPNITPWGTNFNWGTTTSPRYAQMAQHATDFFNLFTDSSLFWSYHRITNTAYELLGYGVIGDLIIPQQAIKPSTAVRLMQIPLNYNVTWFDSFKAIIDIPDTGNVDLKVRTNLRFQNSVDAYGFVICPQDSANALRLVTVISGNYQIGTVVLNVFVPLSTLPAPTFTQVNFIAENKGIMVTAVSDTGVSTPNFTTANMLKQKGERITQIENRSVAFLPNSISIQAYPNPFNSLSLIKFSIGKNSYVTLDIFDANGRYVEQLFKGIADNKVEYVIPFKRKCSSGNYFIRLQTEEHQKTIKLVTLQ